MKASNAASASLLVSAIQISCSDRSAFGCWLLVVHPASRIRLLWVWSVTRGAGPGWGGCDDAPGARVERGGGAQAGADDALTEAGRGTGSPGADHSACG